MSDIKKMIEGRISQVGNVLGAARAEIDHQMLSKAFIETEDYKALISTNDFNFIT